MNRYGDEDDNFVDFGVLFETQVETIESFERCFDILDRKRPL
jgi:hypothetical protein